MHGAAEFFETLVFISWQEMQNVSVFVSSSAVLNAPQNMTPPTKPPSVRKPRLSVAAGVLTIFQTQESKRLILSIAYSPPTCSTPISLMSRKVLPTSGRTSACGT